MLVLPRPLVAFVVVAVPALLAMLAAELFVRARSDYLTPEILRARSLSYDPAVFARHVLSPKAQKVAGPGVGTTYRINQHGYRGDDFSWTKPPGTIRILIYGGSTVFDIGADQGEDWPSLVEERLHEHGLSSAEVINAGIPGHASFDSFGRFFAEGHALRPDIVLLYHQWNDIKIFRKKRSLLREMEPFRPDQDLRYAYRNGLDRALCRTSQVYVRLRARVLNRQATEDLEGRTTREVADHFGPEGPAQFRLSVATFVDAVRNAGAVPILVREARLIAPSNGEGDRSRIPLHYHGLSYAALLRAYAETDSILEEVARTKDVVLVDASTGLSGSERYFVDYVHLNREGAAEVATRVANAVAELIETR